MDRELEKEEPAANGQPPPDDTKGRFNFLGGLLRTKRDKPASDEPAAEEKEPQPEATKEDLTTTMAPPPEYAEVDEAHKEDDGYVKPTIW